MSHFKWKWTIHHSSKIKLTWNLSLLEKAIWQATLHGAGSHWNVWVVAFKQDLVCISLQSTPGSLHCNCISLALRVKVNICMSAWAIFYRCSFSEKYNKCANTLISPELQGLETLSQAQHSSLPGNYRRIIRKIDRLTNKSLMNK